MSLTRADMAEKLFLSHNISRNQAKLFVERFFDHISKSLIANEPVKLSGFGNFNLRDKSSRPGRNPKTGVEVNIAPRRVITFKPGHKLKKCVQP